MPNHKPYVPKTIGEVLDQLTFMSAKSPTFADTFFVERNVDTVFAQLNAGLKNIRRKLGEERYATLVELSQRTRAHFEADPDELNGQTNAGRLLIRDMQTIIERRGS